MSAGNSAQTPGGAIQVFGNLMEIMFSWLLALSSVCPNLFQFAVNPMVTKIHGAFFYADLKLF